MSVIEASGLMKYKDANGNMYIMYPITNKDSVDGMEELDAHLVDCENPHKVSWDQLVSKPFEEVDSELSDSSTNPVQNKVVKAAIDSVKDTIDFSAYETKTDASAKLTEAKTYTDTKVADLVNSAPKTLDTLGELATALQENEDVVETLNAAIGNKADKTDIVQSDWNVNDETSNAYVKNRPFYTTDPVKTVLLGETSVEITGPDSPTPIEMPAEMVVGNTYFITWNGTEYECVSCLCNSLVYVGNLAMGGVGDDTGEPFAIAYVTGGAIFIQASEAGTYTISISANIAENIQLPEKYISYKPGLNVEGKTFTVDETETVAKTGAEIFNDYENNIATGENSHAEGQETIASGAGAHAEGWQTTASGHRAHSEGSKTIASGEISHAEGFSTDATGNCSHAEGDSTTASKYASHAEGQGTVASSGSAHAEGYYTIAASQCQHTQGKYNVKDASNVYAHIVGNGESDTARSNAHTLDWDGNAWYQGDVYVGGTSQDDGSKLVTEVKVDELIAGVNTSISNITNGDTTVAKANEATHATSADTATSATLATKATQDGNGNSIASTYETKTDASSKLAEAKSYADTAATNVKNDLLNGAGTAYDTLKELGDLIDTNVDAIDALETVAAGKADAEHSHEIADVTGLQSALDGKAASSHGTHVTYSTDAPKAPGTASAGSAATVSRTDHVHPEQVSLHGITTAGTGAAYTATVEGITALTAGASFMMIPHTNSTATNATLNVNGLGAKYIRQRLSTNTSLTVAGATAAWLVSGKPIMVTYNGTYWVAELSRQDASYLYGTVPISSGGTDATDATTALTNFGLTADSTSNADIKVNSIAIGDKTLSNVKDSTDTITHISLDSTLNVGTNWLQAGQLQLSSATTPYIDFKYGNSSSYTSRIIAGSSNNLSIGGGEYGMVEINGASGNVIPSTSLNYSLGSTNNRWYKVWVGTSGVDTSSLAELKTDITPFTSALEEIEKTDVFNYKYKETIKREGDDITHTGFVIGDDYNCSELLMGSTKEGIELYSAIGVTFGGVKELYEIVKEQAKVIEELKEKLNNM